MSAYRLRRMPRPERLRLRGLEIHLTRWGPAPSTGRPPLFLLHGWLDTSATFQFMVDALENELPLVALDWRGFGRSEWPQEGYWFPDYLADLDALLDALSPDVPARLVGHSMGGNIASLYAGLRPQRVRSLVLLEAFGLPRTLPDEAPAALRKWLDQVRVPPQPKEYASVEELASVIGFRYPRFGAEKAAFLAAAWSTPAGGRVQLLGDARHRWTNPIRYHREDSEAIWRHVTAPALLVLADDSELLARGGLDVSDEALRRVLPLAEIVRLEAAGHMLHIERPERVAALVEQFVART